VRGHETNLVFSEAGLPEFVDEALRMTAVCKVRDHGGCLILVSHELTLSFLPKRSRDSATTGGRTGTKVRLGECNGRARLRIICQARLAWQLLIKQWRTLDRGVLFREGLIL
jgi:hypothetical protein